MEFLCISRVTREAGEAKLCVSKTLKMEHNFDLARHGKAPSSVLYEVSVVLSHKVKGIIIII